MGILLGMVIALVWAVAFLPLAKGGNTVASTVFVSSSFVGVYFGFSLWLASIHGGLISILPLGYAIGAVLIAFAVYGLLVLMRIFHGVLPVCSMLFLLVVIWAPFRLQEIAVKMWTDPDPGGVRDRDCFSLAGIHILMMLMIVFASLMLWIAFTRGKSLITVITMGTGTIVATVLAGVAFCQTVPRAGDEGTILWLILVPVALVVAVISTLTSLLVPVLRLVRR